MKKFNPFLIFILKLSIGAGFVFAMIRAGAFDTSLLFRAVLNSPFFILGGGGDRFPHDFFG